jgi:hypothetical protein
LAAPTVISPEQNAQCRPRKLALPGVSTFAITITGLMSG